MIDATDRYLRRILKPRVPKCVRADSSERVRAYTSATAGPWSSEHACQYTWVHTWSIEDS